ncbi:MAG: hypothetical protein EP329_18240 [Deltaproteobacteria bacterium]|nr:MAG: hypothetical protein EP329_18240 [Deltaproteobacteria bacterium]
MVRGTLWAWLGALLLIACGRVPDETAMGHAIDGQSCYDCHGDRYLATTSPDHVALGYPQTCEACHGTAAWRPASADSHDFWPLTGTHTPGAVSSAGVVTRCESCHSEGFDGTPNRCDDCHHAQYAATTDPNHVAAGYQTSCDDCHDTDRWQGATVNHDWWPLTGTHEIGALSSAGVATRCESCHSAEVPYEQTPSACYDCHAAQYAGTTAPNHATEGYPTSCADCHNTSRWEGATVNHDFWPLVGVHQVGALSSAGVSTRCESCHTAGVPNDETPTACDACHHDNYVATTAPSHAPLNIPTSCDQCHTPHGWATSTFPQHNALFPITSGNHRNISCRECHTTANTYSTFSCTVCHRLSEMNAEHSQEVASYQTTLNQFGVEPGCLHCHPDGSKEDND